MAEGSRAPEHPKSFGAFLICHPEAGNLPAEGSRVPERPRSFGASGPSG